MCKLIYYILFKKKKKQTVPSGQPSKKSNVVVDSDKQFASLYQQLEKSRNQILEHTKDKQMSSAKQLEKVLDSLKQEEQSSSNVWNL